MHWLLLRGLAREAGHWGDFPDHLREALNGSPVHTPDLPGAGTRFRERCPATVQGIRQSLQAAVAHIPPPYGLIGLSLGGMVALDWAQHAPAGTIQHLVLVNTSTGLNAPWQRMRVQAWGELMRLVVRRDLYRREAGILALSANRPMDATLVQQWYAIQHRRPVTRANALRQIAAAARYRPDPTRPLVNGLLLASRADRLVDWACSAALEQRWQWPLKLHDSAGHDLPLDDPAWVIAQVVALADPGSGASVAGQRASVAMADQP